MKKYFIRALRAVGIQIMRFDKNKVENPALYTDNKDSKLTNLKFSEDKKHIFFGYHDKTPFNLDGNKILACSVPIHKHAEAKPKMQLGYFDKTRNENFDTKFNVFGETTTWCWQQGCMLQWNPANPNSQVIFNKLVNGKYGSVIYDIDKNKVINELNYPVYSVSPDGHYASSLNFSRLEKFRPGYGYKNVNGTGDGTGIPENDGVFIIDLKTDEQELILNLNKLANFTNKQAGHYINHITFSPDGNRIAFFHIYHDKSNQRNVRFYIYDLQTKELNLLEASLMVSHYCWRNNDQIFTTEMGGVTNYYLYDLSNKSKQAVKLPKIGDLHPMFCPVNPSLIVGDSKPDRKRNQHLFLFNIESSDYEHLSSFYSPEIYSGEIRCDLHPRWDREGRYIIVDTAESGKRELVLLDVLETVEQL